VKFRRQKEKEVSVLEKYQTPIISVSKEPSVNVKTEDKRLHTVHFYRKMMIPESFQQMTIKG
jgi:hypothetical protein